MGKERSFRDDYVDFFRILNKNKVDYLIIGAYSVMFHTKRVRTTEDLDTWIRPTDDNIDKLVRAIKEFNNLDIERNDFMDDNSIVYIGIRPYRIEFFRKQGKLNFGEAWKERVKGKFENVPVYYISKDHLLKLKGYFKRDKDKIDIKELRKI